MLSLPATSGAKLLSEQFQPPPWPTSSVSTTRPMEGLAYRVYGCVVNCENVVVENVKINDVAATETTLVGDKGYTGTVTVK